MSSSRSYFCNGVRDRHAGHGQDSHMHKPHPEDQVRARTVSYVLLHFATHKTITCHERYFTLVPGKVAGCYAFDTAARARRAEPAGALRQSSRYALLALQLPSQRSRRKTQH